MPRRASRSLDSHVLGLNGHVRSVTQQISGRGCGAERLQRFTRAAWNTDFACSSGHAEFRGALRYSRGIPTPSNRTSLNDAMLARSGGGAKQKAELTCCGTRRSDDCLLVDRPSESFRTRAVMQRGECERQQCGQYSISIPNGRIGLTIRFESEAEFATFLANGADLAFRRWHLKVLRRPGVSGEGVKSAP
jgi:hypothetical protein